ncbi:MAG TPA: hypothetical protein VJ343_01220, partial [archaeon]|nr:hypothetical protein [archaeon]
MEIMKEEMFENVVDEEKDKKEQEKKRKEMKEKYGVMEEIPMREIRAEEEVVSKPSGFREEKEVNMSELLLRIEKTDGKMEILENFKKDIDERIGYLSENIGELRNMILEKEKNLSEVEKSVGIVLESISDLDADKIKKQLLKRDAEIEEVRANNEKLENMILAVQGENRKFLESMEKVKSVENLLTTSEKIDVKLANLEETKMYAERIATKVEAIFSELSEKLESLEHQKEQIEKMDALTVDIVKMLDEMSIKFAKFVTKIELEAMKDEINKNLSKFGQGQVEFIGKND